MKIIVARTAGFCMGVKRAVDQALEHSGKKSSNVYTLGPLIHNKQTVEMLHQRGVSTLDEQNPPSEPSTILIRAHGVPPGLTDRFKESGHEIVDGTCPKVKTVHKAIERYCNQGYQIFITGDEGHAEVIGLLGYAGEKGTLIQSLDDLNELPEYDRICLVSQTTFDRTLFDLIATRIKERFAESEVVIKKTICSATDQRQAETKQLAKSVDALIVVGGKNSANTQRLAKIAREDGTPTQAVESEKEIDWESISHCSTVGVTAGASTPNWMIKRVCDYLQFMNQTRQKNLPNRILHFFDLLANLNLFVSTGAVAAYYVSCILQGYSFKMAGGIIALFYFLSVYLWNSLASVESTQHLGISRYRFYCAHMKQLLFISGASITTVLIISFLTSQSTFYLMLFAAVTGSMYHLTLVPKPLRKLIPYKKLKDIPTSRDLFVALAWATVITFLPQIMENSLVIKPATAATFSWIFILGYLRSLIFDLRDIEGDRIMGRETLITIVGEKRARKAMFLMIWVCAGILLISPALLGITAYQYSATMRFLFQIPVLFYVALFVWFNKNIKANRSALFSLLADNLFYLAALGAFISSVLIK
ncbi:MAG: 4-hydroxy-3-methylbut-2-enyl diphosphate reductase [Chitinispirillaceae bacterium]